MSLPSVSVPITSYNQADFIQETVLSAVEQDYDNLQVLVFDDASTDATREILLDLASQYSERIELHFNENTLGGGRNRIQSLLAARGDYITYLDGDDLFLPGKIKKQVEFLQDRPEYTLCYHNVEVFESETNQLIYFWKDRFGSGDGGVNKLVRYGNNLCTISVMFRREHLPKLTFHEEVRIGQDWIILIELLMNGSEQYGYIDEVLARHRRHSSNMTLNWAVKLDSQLNTLNIVQERYPQFTAGIRKRRSEINLIHAYLHARRSEYSAAGRYFFKSLQYSFPYFWLLLRLPLRELAFWIKTGGKRDSLLASLLNE